MAESQAVDRVHRIGQGREVVIRRYIVCNSIETVSSKELRKQNSVNQRPLTNEIQYIQWIQQHKLKLVSQCLESDETTQSEIETERWKVGFVCNKF